MKKLVSSAIGVVAAVVMTYVFAPATYAGAALGAINALMNYGMPPELAKYVTGNMVNVDSSGNLVLPAATSKKVSFTVNGTEYGKVDTNGFTGAVVATTMAASGAVSGTTGTFTGTVQAPGLNFPVANYETVAGAGTTTSDAAALATSKHVHQLTGANGTVGWKFGASTAGQFEILLNGTAGVAKIYANTGGTVNGGATDAAFSALTGIKPILCISTAVDTWICS